MQASGLNITGVQVDAFGSGAAGTFADGVGCHIVVVSGLVGNFETSEAKLCLSMTTNGH